MKLVLIFIILGFSARAQESKFEGLYDNFFIDNRKIVWQKIYESNLSEIEIRESLSKNIIFLPISESLKGHTNIFKLTKIVNYGIMPGWERADYQVHVDIEIKDGKYRVTVTDIKMDFSLSSFAEDTKTFTELEKFQLTKEGKFSDKKQGKKGLNCINLTFLDIFDIKKSSIKSEW